MHVDRTTKLLLLVIGLGLWAVAFAQFLTPGPAQAADTMDVNFLPDQEARMYGLEFMLRHEAGGRFFGWLAYSIGRSERQFARPPSTRLEGEWDPDQWALHDMDQTHHLEAVGSWKLGREWTFGTRIQVVSGVPTTPILGYTGDRYEFDADIGDYVPVVVLPP